MNHLALFTLAGGVFAFVSGCSDDIPSDEVTVSEPVQANIDEKGSTKKSAITSVSIQHIETFENPWAIKFEPGTDRLYITHRDGRISIFLPDGRVGNVQGVPEVEFAGQGGLADLAFARDFESSRRVYISWVERGRGRQRGGVVGTAKLTCAEELNCTLEDLRDIWRQVPRTTGQGHYALRLLPSLDGDSLFVVSGDRKEQEPAQDVTNTLGTIVRIDDDGEAVEGNPFFGRSVPTDQIWSFGHRNPLGIAYGLNGKLWAVGHGPVGGDELNLIEPGANFGWPLVSTGSQYNGDQMPAPSTRPDLTPAAIDWTPVIAPSDMIVYDGDLFTGWRGQALISGLASRALIRVSLEGDTPREIARYPMKTRVRSLAEAPDGSIWIAEDGEDGRLMKLTPAS